MCHPVERAASIRPDSSAPAVGVRPSQRYPPTTEAALAAGWISQRSAVSAVNAWKAGRSFSESGLATSSKPQDLRGRVLSHRTPRAPPMASGQSHQPKITNRKVPLGTSPGSPMSATLTAATAASAKTDPADPTSDDAAAQGRVGEGTHQEHAHGREGAAREPFGDRGEREEVDDVAVSQSFDLVRKREDRRRRDEEAASERWRRRRRAG